MDALVTSPLSRRQLLQSLGALIIAGRASAAAHGARAQDALAATVNPGPAPSELDAWLAIGRDGHVTAFFGKPDSGQGVETAIIQIIADELDVDPEQVELIMADTALTCNQGGVSGSTAIARGAIPLRNAAAEARALLLAVACQRLSVPIERLKVNAGIVSVIDDETRRIAYGELVTGYFHHQLDWNGIYGNNLSVAGTATPKTPDQYKWVGTSVPRKDVATKVLGSFQYIADLKRPNMLYGRALRPPVAGARPVAAVEASIAHVRGARVVRKDDFIGVVAKRHAR